MLRIGFLVESDKVSAWVVEIINELSKYEGVELVVGVFFNGQTQQTSSFSFNKFKKFDSSLWPSSADYSKEKMLQLPDHVPGFKVEMETTRHTDPISFSVNIESKISSYRPDLLIYFGSTILKGKIFELSKYGIWSMCFGDKNILNDKMPGFWEWFNKKSRSKISLIKLVNESTHGEVIRNLPIQIYRPSFTKNQSSIYSKAISMMVEEVANLSAIEKSGNDVRVPEQETILLGTKPTRPNGWHILLAFIKLMFRSSKRMFSDLLFIRDWVVFFDISSNQKPSLDFKKFRALIPPRNRFWADPFAVSQDDKHYIFLEEYLWKTRKGHITCIVLDSNGKKVDSNIILEKPYHLSYPFIFQHMGKFYMVPESSANNTIDLYECTQFPFAWTFKRTLISNINAVDTTLHFHENHYWLFCAVQHQLNNPNYDDLLIFHTDNVLEGSWQPHIKNPVVSDIKTARPAGTIFYHDGELCRPSQIGAPYYGYGLSLNRIVELNENSYREESYLTIKPDWRKELDSVHTLNFSSKITVTDGVIRRFRFFN